VPSTLVSGDDSGLDVAPLGSTDAPGEVVVVAGGEDDVGGGVVVDGVVGVVVDGVGVGRGDPTAPVAAGANDCTVGTAQSSAPPTPPPYLRMSRRDTAGDDDAADTVFTGA
jgi:hypothetical protein